MIFVNIYLKKKELNILHLNVKETKLRLVSISSKLNRLDDLIPLLLYDRPVDFDKQYNYLGVIIDSEMTLCPFYSHVQKLYFQRSFVSVSYVHILL